MVEEKPPFGSASAPEILPFGALEIRTGYLFSKAQVVPSVARMGENENMTKDDDLLGCPKRA